jgi:hypothetical protein
MGERPITEDPRPRPSEETMDISDEDGIKHLLAKNDGNRQHRNDDRHSAFGSWCWCFAVVFCCCTSSDGWDDDIGAGGGGCDSKTTDE